MMTVSDSVWFRVQPMALILDELWIQISKINDPGRKNDLRQLVRNLKKTYNDIGNLAVDCNRRQCLTAEFTAQCERFDQQESRIREFITLAILME